jgi:hypothetical protein
MSGTSVQITGCRRNHELEEGRDHAGEGGEGGVVVRYVLTSSVFWCSSEEFLNWGSEV